MQIRLKSLLIVSLLAGTLGGLFSVVWFPAKPLPARIEQTGPAKQAVHRTSGVIQESKLKQAPTNHPGYFISMPKRYAQQTIKRVVDFINSTDTGQALDAIQALSAEQPYVGNALLFELNNICFENITTEVASLWAHRALQQTCQTHKDLIQALAEERIDVRQSQQWDLIGNTSRLYYVALSVQQQRRPEAVAKQIERLLVEAELPQEVEALSRAVTALANNMPASTADSGAPPGEFAQWETDLQRTALALYSCEVFGGCGADSLNLYRYCAYRIACEYGETLAEVYRARLANFPALELQVRQWITKRRQYLSVR